MAITPPAAYASPAATPVFPPASAKRAAVAASFPLEGLEAKGAAAWAVATPGRPEVLTWGGRPSGVWDDEGPRLLVWCVCEGWAGALRGWGRAVGEAGVLCEPRVKMSGRRVTAVEGLEEGV